MSELEYYIKNNYGICDREENCYHGKDANGHLNGCLATGWMGMQCPHWHPVPDTEMEKMKVFFND